jgi:hypothetical protein
MSTKSEKFTTILAISLLFLWIGMLITLFVQNIFYITTPISSLPSAQQSTVYNCQILYTISLVFMCIGVVTQKVGFIQAATLLNLIANCILFGNKCDPKPDFALQSLTGIIISTLLFVFNFIILGFVEMLFKK